MAEYIDREAFKRKLIDEKNFFPAIVSRALEETPTADVVPKSEVERLEEKFAILNEKNAQLALALFRDFPTTKELEVWEACEAVKTKVAREIFAEIEKHGRKMQSSDFSGDFWDIAVLMSEIAELKNKYTEGL